MNSLWRHVIWCTNCTSREGRDEGGKEREDGGREREKGRGEGERGEGRKEGERVREDMGEKKIKVRGGRKEERRLTTNSIFFTK